jgi:GxxExxY protein
MPNPGPFRRSPEKAAHAKTPRRKQRETETGVGKQRRDNGTEKAGHAKTQRRKERKAGIGAQRTAQRKRKGKGEAEMTENEIAKKVVEAAYTVHTRLGPGLLESVYEAVLTHELERCGLRAARQVPVPVVYEGVRFDEGFRADLVVEDKVILELKSVESVAPVHKKQLLTYLRLADKRLGLLINFGAPLIRDGITRIVNNLAE